MDCKKQRLNSKTLPRFDRSTRQTNIIIRFNEKNVRWPVECIIDNRLVLLLGVYNLNKYLFEIKFHMKAHIFKRIYSIFF